MRTFFLVALFLLSISAVAYSQSDIAVDDHLSPDEPSVTFARQALKYSPSGNVCWARELKDEQPDVTLEREGYMSANDYGRPKLIGHRIILINHAQSDKSLIVGLVEYPQEQNGQISLSAVPSDGMQRNTYWHVPAVREYPKWKNDALNVALGQAPVGEIGNGGAIVRQQDPHYRDGTLTARWVRLEGDEKYIKACQISLTSCPCVANQAVTKR